MWLGRLPAATAGTVRQAFKVSTGTGAALEARIASPAVVSTIVTHAASAIIGKAFELAVTIGLAGKAGVAAPAVVTAIVANLSTAAATVARG